jgi:ribosomal protein S15P/S13E
MTKTIEQQILDKGLTAPRLTPEIIKSKVASEQYYVFPGSLLTVCCLTLTNGYNVSGESACASPANFDTEIGQRRARENAVSKIWAIEGYLLKQKLFEVEQNELLGYAGRMDREMIDLSEKINKLTEFLNSEKKNSIPKMDLNLLRGQREYMQNYLETLKSRISRAKI